MEIRRLRLKAPGRVAYVCTQDAVSGDFRAPQKKFSRRAVFFIVASGSPYYIICKYSY